MKITSLLFSLFFSTCIFAQVGINTDDPQSTLDINGNLSVKVVNLTGNNSGDQTNTGSTVVIDDGVYISLLPQAANDTFELPNPVDVPGRVYFLRNVINATTAKIVSDGTAQFFPSYTTLTGTSEIYLYENTTNSDKRKSAIVISDGQNWTVFYGNIF